MDTPINDPAESQYPSESQTVKQRILIMETQQTFGQLLRHLRNQKGLTLRDLAKDLAITHAYLSHLETNLAKPSEDLAKRLAQFFEVDEEELLFLARDIPAQIQEIKEKYPHVAPAYFRRASDSEKRIRITAVG
jgi:HTH-type transcriptional regulator, competence development regulator